MATISYDNTVPKDKCGKPLFRLMSLIRETQCEVEAIKPVLDELEVMRLCHSFGMMSSVDVKDFDFEILNAREFDEDFVRFLRTDLFETNGLGDVRFKGLFGKQTQIIAALVEMKVCPAEVVTLVSELGEEGVYCVKTNSDGSSRSEVADVGKLNGTLVVFSWIRDELFKPQALRHITTLVLRFLTVLAPDIICCMSASDLEQLSEAMIESEMQPSEDVSSYAVSFCIETQEDAQDGTACVERTIVDLHEVLQECSDVSLLKGSYPALAVTKPMKAEIRADPFERTFHRSAFLSFPAWLKTESEQYRIKLSGGIIKSLKLCESILREFQMWPEAQVMESCQARDEMYRRHCESTSKQLDDDIAKQRADLKQIANALFQLRPISPDATLLDEKHVAEYMRFREWVNPAGVWKLDRDSKMKLDIPLRIREIKQAIFDLFLIDQTADLATVLSMCATSTTAQLLGFVDKRRARRQVPNQQSRCVAANWQSFMEKITEPLSKLRYEWWLAVESSLSALKTVSLEKLERDQYRAKCDPDERTKCIIRNEFEQLCALLQSKEGPLMTLNASTRKGIVSCKGTKDVETSSFDVQEVIKVISGECESTVELESLGYVKLNTHETQLALFTVKTRSAVQVCASSEGPMCIKFINFPPVETANKACPANEKVVRRLGKIASLFDFESRTRNMAFLAEDSVAIYKFDETYKQMDLIRTIDLGVHSTLTALPFMDVFLMEKRIYLTDSSGLSQSLHLSTDETSTTVAIANEHGQCSRLMPFADKLAVGVVCLKAQDEDSFELSLKCVSVDNFRHLPVLALEVEYLFDYVHTQCIDKGIVVVDPVAETLSLLSIEVSVQSRSCRLREVADDVDAEESETVADRTECLRKLHWLYTFYHVFEKFPVQGLLNDGQRRAVSILAACPVSTNVGLLLETCHDFFSLLMSDLMALNKPLQGLDLTRGLGVQSGSLDEIKMKSMSLTTFFQTLITFLPIQICRAEANALRLLQDGRSEPLDEDVFLAILNASLSMFTIFRMEMRLDKEVDGLFTKFQKGLSLVKKEDRLFQGSLYMSVKDINSNDGKEVVSEFRTKMQRLLTANCEQNFLNEMYSGKVCINCSPPLGTGGYYTSLVRAKYIVEKIIREQSDSPLAYRSGDSFHNCIRLVLAKISTLDWTTLDETTQQLQMKILCRKLPGVIRTGGLIPADFHTEEKLSKCFIEPVINTDEEVAQLKFDVLVQDHPEWLEQWPGADQFFDEMEDIQVDFGPSVCTQRSTDVFSTEGIDLVFIELFEQYLDLSCKGAIETITASDYAHFDVMVSFLVHRRKVKVALWVKEVLGHDRFIEEWNEIEQGQLGPLKSLLKRCNQHCANCELQCMRSAYHACEMDHDCSTSHVCRGICEFCFKVYEGELPRCVYKAGHEGQCNCGKGDHTCGERCTLATASNCQLICELKTGHDGNHRCSVKQHDKRLIEWNKRKYAPGEKGIAEMCGLYCSSGGRGHVHYLKCPHEQASECVYSGIADQRRHCTTLLSPKPKFELDEVLHGEYWKTIGWEDPCRSAMERALFEQCPYLCDAQEHKGVGKRPSGCDLPAWHRPLTIQAYAVDGKYTYIDGHRFTCSHASSEILHHILVLDCSGSMKGAPWKALEKAVRGYLRGRMECGLYDDIVSVVTFGDEGRIEYEGVKIRRAATRQFNFHGGGTYYAKGLREALALISRTDTKTYRPVVIFFTDGRPADRKQGLKMGASLRKYASVGLRVFVVGFGRVSDFGLEDLASALGGKMHEACSMDMLTETFRSISMSLGACAGLICN
ncbi:hypothetical protein PsorP6_005051 [Peronosclerospora sorghi]|uniref:Uncharacterized protein n=1 Tax=Peronosclerospora sorghi TaxID=230839 RepID=A0ACC0W1Q9_9STRA|nr:hypothetical protein PsorP6_005051 [Peronosclerospora sorghi]